MCVSFGFAISCPFIQIISHATPLSTFFILLPTSYLSFTKETSGFWNPRKLNFLLCLSGSSSSSSFQISQKLVTHDLHSFLSKSTNIQFKMNFQEFIFFSYILTHTKQQQTWQEIIADYHYSDTGIEVCHEYMHTNTH